MEPLRQYIPNASTIVDHGGCVPGNGDLATTSEGKRFCNEARMVLHWLRRLSARPRLPRLHPLLCVKTCTISAFACRPTNQKAKTRHTNYQRQQESNNNNNNRNDIINNNNTDIPKNVSVYTSTHACYQQQFNLLSFLIFAWGADGSFVM